jgi:hypothetical protein
MRINLDKPVPDDPSELIEAEAEDTSAEDEEAPDGFVIRRDLLTQKRRRKIPKELTPFQLRLIAVGLVVVILAAGGSLLVYLQGVRSNAERLPPQALAPRTGVRPQTQMQGQTGYRFQRASPPLGVMEPGPERTHDNEAPAEGIH